MRKVPHHGPCAEKNVRPVPSATTQYCFTPLHSTPYQLSYPWSLYPQGQHPQQCTCPPHFCTPTFYHTYTLATYSLCTYTLITSTHLPSLPYLACAFRWFFYPQRFSTIPSPHHLVFAFLHTWGLQRLHSTPSRGVSCLALRLR